MNGKQRGITIMLLATVCLLIGLAMPPHAFASGLPNNGLQEFSGYIDTGDSLSSPGGHFMVTGYVNNSVSPLLSMVESYILLDDYYTDAETLKTSVQQDAYIEFKASGLLKSFKLQGASIGEFDIMVTGGRDPQFTNITIKGYAGTTEVFSTNPYNSMTGTLETNFGIDYTIAQDKIIDSFRIYYRKLNGTYHCEFNITSFTISGASSSPPMLSNDASLKASSKIKGQPVASLGTPGGTAAAASAGSVTLTSVQAANTTNQSPYSTLLEANDSKVSLVKIVKYATGASIASFETDTAYANQAVSNGDFFIIKVVAQDGATTNYYRIAVTVKSGDAGLASVAGQSVTPGVQPGTAGNPKTASITVANSVTQIVAGDVEPSNSNAEVWISPDSSYGTNVISTSLVAGENTPVYIRIKSEDLTATLFYAVTVYREPIYIGAAAVTMTAPIAGGTPQTASAVEALTNQADYTVTNVIWNGSLTPQSKFAADTAYSATVTLQSKNGKAFQAGSFLPTLDDENAAAGTTTTTGTGIGNTVSFTVIFPKTAAKQLSSIAVTTQPAKMSYTETEDGVLDLSGMVVTQTYNDGSQDTKTFTNGTADGYTTTPANGAALTNAGHHNQKVTVTHTATGQTAETTSLTVLPTPTYEISLSEASYTFPTKTIGYGVSPTHGVTVSNTGTGATGNLTVALSGANADSFVISTGLIQSLAPLGIESFIIWPRESLPVGTYTATVTVSGGGSIGSKSIDVYFTVEHSYSISLDQHKTYDFPQATLGYGAQTPLTVTVSNTGTGATGLLMVSLSGANADCFELSTTSIGNLAPASSTTFTVVPKTGLAQDMYEATVSVSGSAVGTEEFDVSFTVFPIFSIELDPADAYVFPAAIVGYGEQPPRSFTVSNTGTYETFDLTVALSGINASCFELSAITIASIDVSGSDVFTIKPVAGLGIGTYTATVTVSGDYADAQILNISFTVDPEPTHIIALNPDADHTFPAATVGYGAQPAYQVTVNSTGTGDSGALAVALSGANADAFALSKPSIPSIPTSGSGSFTVVPKTGLAEGTYVATVTVSGGSVASKFFNVYFTVDPSYIIALSPENEYTFPEATVGYGAQTGCEVTVSSIGTGASGTLAIALSGTNANAFELNKTSIGSIASSLSDSFIITPKSGLAAGTYTATVTLAGARIMQKSIQVTFKVNYAMSQGTLTEVVSPTTTIIADGMFAKEAQLIVTPLGSGDGDREELEGQAGERNAIAAYEVHVEPAEAFLPPLTLTFQVGEKYNGHTVYILHKLGNGEIDIYQPIVANGQAVITVYELSPFLLAIDPAVILSEQPQSATALIGATTTFSVKAEGLEPFTYQWQRRTSVNGEWRDIAGAAGPSYTTTKLNKSHNGYAYRVIVTDVLGNTATSNIAVLTVTKSPATGDASQPLVYTVMTILFAVAAIVIFRKRKTA